MWSGILEKVRIVHPLLCLKFATKRYVTAGMRNVWPRELPVLGGLRAPFRGDCDGPVECRDCHGARPAKQELMAGGKLGACRKAADGWNGWMQLLGSVIILFDLLSHRACCVDRWPFSSFPYPPLSIIPAEGPPSVLFPFRNDELHDLRRHR